MVAFVATSLAIGVAQSASADVRRGGVDDPVGDSTGGATRDITRFAASYDQNGRIYGNVTFAAPYDPAQPSFVSMKFASIDGSTCGGVSASLFGFQDSASPIFTIDGVRGTGSGFGTQLDTTSVAFSATNSQLANRDWKCVTVTVSPKDGDGTISDQLTGPLYFDGFAPDSDGDGVADSIDKCPTVAAPGTADGCVPPATTPAPTPGGGSGSGTAPATTTASATFKALKTVKRGKSTALRLTVKNPTSALIKGVKVMFTAPKNTTFKNGKKRSKTVTVALGDIGVGKTKTASVTVQTTKKSRKSSTIAVKVQPTGLKSTKVSVPLKTR
ncbi:hypothetical protein [Patulibacter minatonensis]|uniref:hypothetical protein n=1 Tax=Patulibacter minatonensis TaxID=298163 RepID=UPI00047CC2DE|nr:hypothetical protein [Patulibacter minatonensis]